MLAEDATVIKILSGYVVIQLAASLWVRRRQRMRRAQISEIVSRKNCSLHRLRNCSVILGYAYDFQGIVTSSIMNPPCIRIYVAHAYHSSVTNVFLFCAVHCDTVTEC